MVEKSIFIFGLGFSAQAVARAALKAGFKVAGTSRTQEKCAELKEQGIDAILFENVTAELLSNYNCILSSIPPQGSGDIVIPLLTRHQILATDRWLGYFSTTGVYGDHGGAWVNETSDLRPRNKRLLRRLVAEAQWRVRGGHVFRLAGIYGKGRSVIDDVMDRTARRIEKEGQVFSRIHNEDIAQTILASIAKPNPLAVYNVCDDEPAAAHEVVDFACNLLGQEAPPLIPFADAEFSPMGKEFYSANRRVSNKRIKEELGVKLLYPTYREGLKALTSSPSGRRVG